MILIGTVLFTTKVHSLNALFLRLICQISVRRWSFSEQIPEAIWLHLWE